MSRVIAHLDMDAFFASVEQRDNPVLKGSPVIVGGLPTQRGVVSAASYEARKFGVHSAMPSTTAARLCPNGIFLRPRMDAYRAESAAIMEIMAKSGAIIEQVSIDEAYLDLSKLATATDPDEALQTVLPIARALKEQILAERQLTASIGVATNKMLSKIGSDFCKPNGLTVVPFRERAAFLRPLKVRSIHGVGKVTETVLEEVGIRTIGDLQDYSGNLRELVGSFADSLRQYAFGDDDRPLDLGDTVKSISSEETFARNTEDRKLLQQSLKTQADDLAEKLKSKRLTAKTIQVKVRYGDFSTLTRQFTLDEPTVETGEIYRIACHLLKRDKLVHSPLRLLGLGVTSLAPVHASQLPLQF